MKARWMQKKRLLVGIFDDSAEIPFICEKKAKYNHHSYLAGNRVFFISLLSTLTCRTPGLSCLSFCLECVQVKNG